MARRPTAVTIGSRTAREKLQPRRKPYYGYSLAGLHVGYRKNFKTEGTWVVRLYQGSGSYRTVTLDGVADDERDADGVTVRTFEDAVALAQRIQQDAARGRNSDDALRPLPSGPYTVDAALDDYLDALEERGGKAIETARGIADRWIRPKLGKRGVDQLAASEIRAWHRAIARERPRVRAKKGAAVKHRDVEHDSDWQRRRRSTANRVLSVLKASLNHAFREERCDSDSAWRRVEAFEGADGARVRYLTVSEAQKLLKACTGPFRSLVEAGLVTGARYGELTRLVVADFDSTGATVHVRESKSGKARHIILNDEGLALFKTMTADRPEDALIFERAPGIAWSKSDQHRPMKDATKAAGLAGISFHALRHTFASLSIMQGMPPNVAARALGHADTRMVERHYGHLSSGYLTKTIRAKTPKFGIGNLGTSKRRQREEIST